MPKEGRKVLITGASIAGPTLAYWLHQYGFTVTVVERAPALRMGGQNIEVSGAARQIARKMGIEADIRAASTGEAGTRYVDRHNRTKATFLKDSSNGPTSELEMLRDDLVNILFERTRHDVNYLFGTYITNIEQGSSHAAVTFGNGQTRHYDLVIAADGVRSKTRELMFGKEPVFQYLGLCTAYLTIPKTPTDTDWARWYTATDCRVVLLRPDNKGTTRASLTFLYPEREYKKLSPADHKQLLIKKIEGAGWESDRLLTELARSGDFYFDGVGQIKAPRWSKGRLAMVGDAAYCPSSITGKGTTLAMVGAYILAGELAMHDRHQEAFASYEKHMRPYVEVVQKGLPGLTSLFYPESALGVTILNGLAGVLASKPGQTITAFFSGGKAKRKEDAGIDLPDYRADVVDG